MIPFFTPPACPNVHVMSDADLHEKISLYKGMSIRNNPTISSVIDNIIY